MTFNGSISDLSRRLISDERGAFEPLSGQLLLDFSTDDLESQISEVVSLESAPAVGATGATSASCAW